MLYALIDPPPAVAGVGGDPSTGLWLALAAATLIAAGGVLSLARISVAFDARAPSEPATPPTDPTRPL